MIVSLVISIDVLSNVTFDWATIFNSIFFQTSSGKYLGVSGRSISWSPIPQFPACQTLNISHYFDVKSLVTARHFYFNFKKTKNLRLTLEIGDIRKSLIKRKLKSNGFDCEGTVIELKDLWSTKVKTYAIREAFKNYQT